mmetsp:Transcript_48563/g.105814  ORF Transcript_48563/g.105814 Transcript_48563/m.105814 type:complete len:93 (-) Transcript_48563:1142-1420(-)
MTAKSDYSFVEISFKLMRNELKVFPKLNVNQFLSMGFTAVKSALINTVIDKIIDLKQRINQHNNELLTNPNLIKSKNKNKNQHVYNKDNHKV